MAPLTQRPPSTGLGAGLLSPAVAALDRRVLVASCRRVLVASCGVSPAVAALDWLRRGPAAACSRRPSPPSTGMCWWRAALSAESRRPSPPSTGLGAGRRRPALAGRRRPRQGCAGGELLSRPAFAVRSSFFVAVFLWCNLRLLNEYSGSQAASGPGPLAWH